MTLIIQINHTCLLSYRSTIHDSYHHYDSYHTDKVGSVNNIIQRLKLLPSNWAVRSGSPKDKKKSIVH